MRNERDCHTLQNTANNVKNTIFFMTTSTKDFIVSPGRNPVNLVTEEFEYQKSREFPWRRENEMITHSRNLKKLLFLRVS